MAIPSCPMRFFQAMQSQHLIPDSAETQISFAQLQKEMPVTKMDSLIGAIQITNLKTGWPFNQPIPAGYKQDTSLSGTLAAQIESAQLNWAGGMSQLYSFYKSSNDKEGALRAMKAMNLEYPTEKQYSGDAANIAAIVGDCDEAIFLLYETQPVRSKRSVNYTHIPDVFTCE